MSQENEKSIDVDKLLRNKLKSLPVSDIENGIAKVISELVGEDYKCSVDNIKFTLFSGAEFHVKVELSINSD